MHTASNHGLGILVDGDHLGGTLFKRGNTGAATTQTSADYQNVAILRAGNLVARNRLGCNFPAVQTCNVGTRRSTALGNRKAAFGACSAIARGGAGLLRRATCHTCHRGTGKRGSTQAEKRSTGQTLLHLLLILHVTPSSFSLFCKCGSHRSPAFRHPVGCEPICTRPSDHAWPTLVRTP